MIDVQKEVWNWILQKNKVHKTLEEAMVSFGKYLINKYRLED